MSSFAAFEHKNEQTFSCTPPTPGCSQNKITSSSKSENPGELDFVWWKGYQANANGLPKGNKLLEFLVVKAFPREEDASGEDNLCPYPFFLKYSCGEQLFDLAIVFIWRKLGRKFWIKGVEQGALAMIDEREMDRVHSVTKKVKQKVRTSMRGEGGAGEDQCRPFWVPPPSTGRRTRKKQVSSKAFPIP